MSVPRRRGVRAWHMACIYAGGACGTLLVAFFVAIHIHSSAHVRGWELPLAVVAVYHSLLPLLPNAGTPVQRSDGKHLMELFGSNGRAKCAVLELIGITYGREAPEIWESPSIPALIAAATEATSPFDRLAANTLAYFWAMSRQDGERAMKYLESALACSHCAASNVRLLLFKQADFVQMRFRHDLKTALAWMKELRDEEGSPRIARTPATLICGSRMS